MLELWGCGQDYAELESSIFTNVPKESIVRKRIIMVCLYRALIQEPYTRNDYTFKVIASGFARKCSAERQQMIYEVDE